MSRKKITPELRRPRHDGLASRLAAELKSDKESSQPLVYEVEPLPDRFNVSVVWDEWDRVPMPERFGVIRLAYELAEGPAYRDKIVIGTGFTVPEATEAGLLPFQVATALRKSDPFTWQQCQEAMLAAGASSLFGPDVIQLRFGTREEAEACRRRLAARLPGSGEVWVINREINAQDPVTLRDLADAEG